MLHNFHEQLRPVTAYLRPSALRTVRLALETATLAHHGQCRRSGEPFIIHPVAVAIILAASNMDAVTVSAGLLHDTVEDTCLTFEEVEELFGFEVRKIVEGETKVSKLPKMVRSQMDGEALIVHPDKTTSKAQEQVENMRSMFIAMADDWRIVVVKLADRLHNMRTLQYMPLEKRASIARETLEIFAPLAHRLGMWQFKTELSDLSFKYLFPAEYEQLDRKINSQFVQYQETLEEAQTALEAQLQADPWLQGRLRSVSVVGRTKSIYSTFKKMQRHQCGIERIHDLVALRVVLNPEIAGGGSGGSGSSSSSSSSSSSGGGGGASGTSSSGADATGVSTQDENAMCYHVLGKVHATYTPLPRTLKDYISSPKPNGYRSLHTTVLVGTQPLEVQIRTQAMHLIAEYGAAAHWAYKDGASSLPWLEVIREWEAQVDSAQEFMRLVRQELLGTRVFVFTRNGRILNLPHGSTLADAAAHQKLGLSTHSPLVNGKAARWSRELQNGDIVSFERSSMRLVARLANEVVPPALADADDYAGLDPQIMGMGLKQRAQRYLKAKESRRLQTWQLCTECQPLVGDDLLGASADAPSEASSGMIHRAVGRCATLQTQLDQKGYRLVDPHGQSRLVDAHGQSGQREAFRAALDAQCESDNGLPASLVVFCADRRGMLVDVASVVTDGVTNILNVHSEIFDKGGKSCLRYDVTVQDRQQLEVVMKAVREVPDVSDVLRISTELDEDQ